MANGLYFNTVLLFNQYNQSTLDYSLHPHLTIHTELFYATKLILIDHSVQTNQCFKTHSYSDETNTKGSGGSVSDTGTLQHVTEWNCS